MGYVFISYSTRDQSSADAILSILKENKIETWMAPGDIPLGEKYGAVINNAIKNASCFLLVLTNDAQNSKWVPKEVETAINYSIPIIPVKLENLVLNDEFEFYISTNQLITLPKIDKNSSEFQKLITAICAYMSTTSASNSIYTKTNIDTDINQLMGTIMKKVMELSQLTFKLYPNAGNPHRSLLQFEETLKPHDRDVLKQIRRVRNEGAHGIEQDFEFFGVTAIPFLDLLCEKVKSLI